MKDDMPKTILQAEMVLAITEFLMEVTIDEFIEQDNANGRVVDWNRLAGSMNTATRKLLQSTEKYISYKGGF